MEVERERESGREVERALHKIRHNDKDLTKIFESVIDPIALYACQVWGPLTKQTFTKWDKHQIETLACRILQKYPLCTM